MVTKRYGLVMVLLAAALLLATPAAAEICWGKICSSSPFRDSGLCVVCCGGHGTCVGFNNCQCNDGWATGECLMWTRCGPTCPADCNGADHGMCSPSATTDFPNNSTTGQCYCADGITGTCCDSYRQGTLNPSVLAFGSVMTGSTGSAPSPVTYTNPKAASNMTVQTITIGGANSGDFSVSGGTCAAATNVTGSGTCTVSVTFTPAAAGSRTATLTVTTTDPDHGDNSQTLTTTLSGTGVAASSGGSDSGSSGSGSSGSSGGSDSDSGGSSSGSSGTTGTYNANVGGNSAVNTVTVTGTGVNNIIVTGTQQGSLPAGVPPVDPNAFQYIELTPARAGTITGASISFDVPVVWLEEHGLTTGDVAMNHYSNGQWTTLPTTFSGVSNGIAHYTAQSPGFSLFAIAPKKGGAQAAPLQQTCPSAQPFSCPVCPSLTQAACPGLLSGSQVIASGVTGSEPAADGTESSFPTTGFPLAIIALIGAGCIVLVGGGWYVRRWYIRRQNPALFSEYD